MTPALVARLLWIVLAAAVLLVVSMTWHPWVVGAHAGCAPGAVRAWDGRCYPVKETP